MIDVKINKYSKFGMWHWSYPAGKWSHYTGCAFTRWGAEWAAKRLHKKLNKPEIGYIFKLDNPNNLSESVNKNATF